jgi:hypothetical protein
VPFPPAQADATAGDLSLVPDPFDATAWTMIGLFMGLELLLMK